MSLNICNQFKFYPTENACSKFETFPKLFTINIIMKMTS